MNLAFIGTGKIVAEALVAAKISDINYKAIWSRPKSIDKAKNLASQYGIERIYTDYDKLLGDSNIDFVYIGLINSVHYEYAKKALLAGKNVILEKPFCPTLRETCELIELATTQNLFLFDAVSFLYMPTFKFLQDELKNIGAVKLVQANYSQYSSRYDDYKRGIVQPAFDAKAFGGALYDINFYNITLIVALFGAPQDISYQANIGFNGVDTSGVMTMRYPSFIAMAAGAKDSASPSFFIAQGENGYLQVDGAPNAMTNAASINRNGTAKRQENNNEHRLTAEFRTFNEIYRTHDFKRMRDKLAITENVIKILETARPKYK